MLLKQLPAFEDPAKTLVFTGFDGIETNALAGSGPPSPSPLFLF